VFIFKEPKLEKHSHLPFGFDLIEKPFNWGEDKKKPVKSKSNKPKIIKSHHLSTEQISGYLQNAS
jgi:hypothetical protein